MILYGSLIAVLAITAFGVFAKWRPARVWSSIAILGIAFACTLFLPAAFSRGLMDAVGSDQSFRGGVLALSSALHSLQLIAFASAVALTILGFAGRSK